MGSGKRRIRMWKPKIYETHGGGAGAEVFRGLQGWSYRIWREWRLGKDSISVTSAKGYATPDEAMTAAEEAMKRLPTT